MTTADNRIQPSPSRPTRQYTLDDAEDRKKLRSLRKSMLTRTHRVVATAFEELRFNYRISRRNVRRLVGPGIITSITKAGRPSEFRHDVALGVVRLRSAIGAGHVGKWALRKDGTRSRLLVDDVPDMEFNTPTDWRQIVEFVLAQGWTYQAFARLAGTQTSQISRLSWGQHMPRTTLGESVLWGARYIRDAIIITPATPEMSYRRPAPRMTREERDRPWWMPDPIADDVFRD